MPCLISASFPSARVGAATFAVAAMVFLGGCQSGNSPSAPGPTTATPALTASAPITPSPGSTPAPSSTATYKPADAKGKAQNVPVPVMPALAKENSKEGLEAFIRYWYAQQNYAAETGETRAWTDMTDKDCLACNKILEGLQDSYINGRWLTGGKITIPALESIWSPGKVVQQAKVQVVQEKTNYYNADGTEGRSSQRATNSAFGVTSAYGADGWKVKDLGLIR